LIFLNRKCACHVIDKENQGIGGFGLHMRSICSQQPTKMHF